MNNPIFSSVLIFLSGPSTICNQATYTIENLPAGATVQWSLSNSNAIILSSTTNTITLKYSGTGSVELRANIRINGTPLNINKQISLFRPILEASVYDNETGWHNADISYGRIILNLYQFTPNREIYFSSNNQSLINIPISNWEWENYNPDIVSVSHQGGYIAYLTPLREGYARVNVRVKIEGCYTNIVTLAIQVTSGSPFTLTPNPATDVVTVRLNETETPQTTQSLSKTAALPGVYEIQLWSAGAMIRSYKTDRSAFEMPVSDLPAGIYFVCVVKEGKTYTEKLIVD